VVSDKKPRRLWQAGSKEWFLMRSGPERMVSAHDTGG
jgi:hypothetical protein